MNSLETFLKEKNFDIHPELDDQFHRFDRDGKGNGWFIGKEITEKNPPLIIASVGDWKTDERYDFISVTEFSSKEDEKNVKDYLAKARKAAEAQKEKDQNEAASRSEQRWNEASLQGESEYLSRKHSQGSYGQRYSANSFGSTDVLIACKDIGGKIWGLQKIQPDGAKFFTPGQKITGCFHLIGEINDHIFICEGFATAVSVFQATGKATISAFNAGNLVEVSRCIRNAYPTAIITICCDDDKWTNRRGVPHNPGIEFGKDAAKNCRGNFVSPKFRNLDTRPTDFNDLQILEGLDEVKAQLSCSSHHKPNEIIDTELTGFHDIITRGKQKFYMPNYEDLRKYFNRSSPYKILGESGIVLTWNGKHYTELKDPYIEAFAQKHFYPVAHNKMVSEFIKLVRRHQLTPNEWFYSTTHKKINFQNGVLDLQDMSFRPHSQDLGFRYVLAYNYEPQATCPTFDKFLKDVTQSDLDLEKVLLEYAGYALSSDSCWVQKALILEGEGSNGKSTFMNMLRRLAGQNNYAPLSLSDLKNDNKRQMLDGKLFNMAEETPSKSMMESSIFKNLVSGGETTAKLLYKNMYTFKNRAKLIFACNELPHSSDATKGYLRRFIIAPFRAEFSREKGNVDPFIEKKLSLELPGIFNKIISAYKEMAERQEFTQSNAASEALREYQRDIDPILDFIKEDLDCHPLGNGHDDKVVKMNDLYLAYSHKAKTQGIDVINERVFGKRLKKTLPEYEKRFKHGKLHGKTARYLIGLTRSTGEDF